MYTIDIIIVFRGAYKPKSRIYICTLYNIHIYTMYMYLCIYVYTYIRMYIVSEWHLQGAYKPI